MMKQQSYNHTKCRLSAIIQVLFGFVCIVFGIADRVEVTEKHDSGFPARIAIGIWMGVLILVTGIIGFVASLQVNVQRRYLVIIYFVSSIIAGVLGLAIADCYIVSHVLISREGDCKNMGSPVSLYYGIVKADEQCEVRKKLATIMIVMSLCEVFGAIMAIYCCIRIYRSKKEYDLEKHRESNRDPNRLETLNATHPQSPRAGSPPRSPPQSPTQLLTQPQPHAADNPVVQVVPAEV